MPIYLSCGGRSDPHSLAPTDNHVAQAGLRHSTKGLHDLSVSSRKKKRLHVDMKLSAYFFPQDRESVLRTVMKREDLVLVGQIRVHMRARTAMGCMAVLHCTLK